MPRRAGFQWLPRMRAWVTDCPLTAYSVSSFADTKLTIELARMAHCAMTDDDEDVWDVGGPDAEG